MSPEKQRIAIATACGWKRHETKFGHEWEQPDGKRGWQEAANEDEDDWIVFPPDYLNSLDAMIEAEDTLSGHIGFEFEGAIYSSQRSFFVCALIDILNRDPVGTFQWPTLGLTAEHVFEIAYAPTSHRAEAFLKTIGLWETTMEPTQMKKGTIESSP